MASNKLQLYFDYFVEHYNPKGFDWYKSLTHALEVIKAIKENIRTIDNFSDLDDKNDILEKKISEATNNEIVSIESFLDRFIFQQNNGVGDVKQGVVWDTDPNPHRQQIIENATPDLIFQILTQSDKKIVENDVWTLLKIERSLDAVHNRFLRVLFPHVYGSPDAPNKLERLITLLKNKLGIEILANDRAAKHQEICNLIKTEDAALRQIFTWEIYFIIEHEFSLKKAVCFYGAPGTGKTYHSSREAKRLIDAHRILLEKEIGNEYSIKTVQFHPSYSYEDFIEGIRPNKNGDLQIFNGSFKQFCKKNGKKELELYKTDFLNKTDFIDVDYDFARIKINQLDENEKKALGLLNNSYAEDLTIQDAIEPAFFIIDEINRAELSKVFGELMYSLEYRGFSGKIKTQYSHLCSSIDEDASFFWYDNENWFFIPQNIFIISTMNNIDRSVDAFDFALRRRFMWKEVHPNYNIIEQLLLYSGWGELSNKVPNKLKRLNDLIENDDVLDKNYRIGQSYILELTKMNPNRFDNQNKATEFLWNSFIAPLLEEYLKGLGDETKTREKIEKFKKAFLQ